MSRYAEFNDGNVLACFFDSIVCPFKHLLQTSLSLHFHLNQIQL